MNSIQQKIKELGLMKVSKSGGKRSIKRKSNLSLDKRIESMIKDKRPIPKHLMKKAEKIYNNLNQNTTETENTTENITENITENTNENDLPNFDLTNCDTSDTSEEPPELVVL